MGGAGAMTAVATDTARTPATSQSQVASAALLLIGAAALFVGLALRKPILKILFDGALHVTEEGWRILTWRWAFFF